MSRDRPDDLGRGPAPAAGRTGEPPPGVAARMAALRGSYVPETVAAGAERLAREGPAPKEQPFEVAVARRLQELRSLLELAAYLHGVARQSSPASPQEAQAADPD